MIKNKIENFLKLDLRWKLIRLSKLFKFSLYPDYFSFRGLKKNYHSFLFERIFLNKAKQKKLLLKKRLHLLQSYSDNKRIKLLVSSPGSGSNYMRCMLESYLELTLKLGNGIPKFDSINNSWIFSGSHILMSDLFNFIDLNLRVTYHHNFKENNNFDNIIFFSRFPFDRMDLIKKEKSLPVILFREPLDWMISYYIHHQEKNSPITNNYFWLQGRRPLKIKKDIQLIKKSISKLKKYYLFWLNYSDNNKKILFIDYKTLINKSNKVLKDVLHFYNFKSINQKNIQKSVKFNSKKFTLKYLDNEFTGTRFTNTLRKNKIKNLISASIMQEIKREKIDEIYKKLLTKVSK